jgi:phage terminase large subunit
VSTLRIPNEWEPREYQLPLLQYLDTGGKRAVCTWHRRSGKDSVCLNVTAKAAMKRPAGYWHLLPKADQARKALWNAINPHSGRRLIDQAFPHEIRELTRENEMFIRFRNGSTWQLMGSDNFNTFMGSTPAGVNFSEYALGKPQAWDFVRPILMENGGWAIFNSTPRGRNHHFKLREMAKKNPDWFEQTLTVDDTGIVTRAQIEQELDSGMEPALVDQEYYCSFEAAMVGSYYADVLAKMRREGRMLPDLYDPELPVIPVLDIGYTDDTSIVFGQVHRNEIRIIDEFSDNAEDVEHYSKIMAERGYRYEGQTERSNGVVWLPHDAKAKTMAAKGKSIAEQFRALGWTVRIVPEMSVQNGIAAARKVLASAYIDPETCEDAVEAWTHYQRAWDADKRAYGKQPVHDWSSHRADALRYFSIIVQEKAPPAPALVPDWRVQAARGPSFEHARNLARQRRIGAS